MRIVLATHNQHKVQDFRYLLRDLPEIELVGYDGPEPVESGVTFVDNARIKAQAAAEATGEVALADDSGIAVDVLGGAPGVFSARWAGSRKSDDANLQLLLEQLADVPDEHRGAAFVCALVVARPGGAPGVQSEGRWTGRLIREARGRNGFGYDPIFLPDGSTLTAGEITAEEKNARSHRAIAVSALVPLLRTKVIPE